jgi:ssDNA-binding Zn-finger/Zn-ribbon topoisomerase 1
VYRAYPVDGGFISFDDLAAKVVDPKTSKSRLRATWATPGSGRHMFAKTLEARVTRLVWADVTRGLYLREEMGTFRMPQDQTPEGAEDPDVVVDTADLDADFAPPPVRVCPKCGKGLVVRSGQRGEFLACPGYPKCKFSMDLPEEEESEGPSDDDEEEATSGPPPASPAPDTPAPAGAPSNLWADEEEEATVPAEAPAEVEPAQKTPQEQAEGFVSKLTDAEVDLAEEVAYTSASGQPRKKKVHHGAFVEQLERACGDAGRAKAWLEKKFATSNLKNITIAQMREVLPELLLAGDGSLQAEQE